MVDIAKDPAHGGLWSTIVARPGMVVTRGTYFGEAAMMMAGNSGSCVRSDELAICLLDVALHGGDELLVPQTILHRARELEALRDSERPV